VVRMGDLVNEVSTNGSLVYPNRARTFKRGRLLAAYLGAPMAAKTLPCPR